MPYIGEISGLATALFWSFTAIAFSDASERVGSVQTNINRLLLASVFLFLTILIFNIDYNMSTRQIIMLSISGIIGLVIGDSFLFRAYQHIGPRLGVLLMAFAPILSAILAYFFLSETIAVLGIVGMLITISGIFMVVLERSEKPAVKYKISKIGFFMGFMAALGQAAGLIFAKMAFDESPINGFTATFVRITSSIIVFLPLLLVARQYKNPVKLYSQDRKALKSTLVGTVLGPFLGITFSLISVSHTKVGIASTLMSTMPVIMLPIAKYYYKESLSWRAIIGALITVAGIALLFLR
jgi:drug/metabolite transporter (DMT)-like permease